MPMRDVELVEREVEDPYFNPARAGADNAETVTVTVSLRESSIAQMHARGQIDDAQRTAADRLRAVYERSGLGGLASLDLSRQRVDGGQRGGGPSDVRLDAIAELIRLSRELGKVGYPVCIQVCGERRSVREMADAMLGRTANKRELDYYGRLLRDHLDLLCIHWGYKQAPRPPR